ncbi:hypothetical protein EPA93_47400 [Ktedonosporobacter rubrisoli]|uniref:Uncharacterized protein n=1 Tax=Ktedonosporobacter rubrisoli TaxID=2509675 RepID=A0A4P6K6G0_KTERU|nr:phosphotransferase [Ktedonosporobacter rubrisoli]QBD83186.1 hypothetical protein EPA93_47400 [Ktedonosporobacter rubrisoli]
MMDEHELASEREQEELLDLNEVMRAFGIDAWKNLGPTDTAYSDNFGLLVDVQGQRYVLRERPEGPLGEDQGHRYVFRRYLQQQGIPIPALWPTPQGEAAAQVGEDHFELEQWSGGELFSSSDSRALDWVSFAGSMLGRIHQASQHYQGPQYKWPAEAHMGSVVQSYLNLARSRADTCELQALAVALENWADQWEAVLPSAMMSIGAVRGLPEFHIHGDYHALNLRFNSLGVAAVLGLEASRWEKRIFEVAYALFYFCALAWQPGEKLTRPLLKRGLDPLRARNFLRAYGELCPPARGEAEALTDALTLIAPIATINGPLEDLFYGPQEAEEDSMDDLLERLYWASTLPAWLRRVRHSLAEMW